MNIDLHSHTTISDGKLSPEELIARAVNNKLDCLAITDHDSVDGLARAHQANKVLDKEANGRLILINGVEISSSWHDVQVHIVGLNIQPTHPTLIQFLKAQQLLRQQRAKQIDASLQNAGIAGAYQAALALSCNQLITRSHFAQVLCQQGFANNYTEVFKNFLTLGKPGYVACQWPNINTAITIVKQAGGQAVLAHPRRYKLTNNQLKRLVADFKAAGGEALEVAFCQQTQQDQLYLCHLSSYYQLTASLGSDFHAPSPWQDIGKNVSLPKNVIPIWHNWNLNL